MKSPYVVRRPVENEYLVRERDRKLRHDLLTVLACVAVLGSGLLAYTWIHLEITAVGYDVDRLEKQLHERGQTERHLRLRATELSHPRIIEQRAAAELDMHPPTVQQVIFPNEVAAGQLVNGGIER